MVSVTGEALQTIKTALSEFKTDIEGIVGQSNNKADKVLNESQVKVLEAEQDVAHTEAKIEKIKCNIESLENEISQIGSKINMLENTILQMYQRIWSLENQIASMKSQVVELRSQLENAEDDDQREQIRSKIYGLEKRISQCDSECNDLKAHIRNAENEKVSLQRELNSVKLKKSQCELELSTEKNRCNKQRNKLERLRTIFRKMELDLREYVDAAKKFEASSGSSAQKNISAVDRCILSINSYMSVSM